MYMFVELLKIDGAFEGIINWIILKALLLANDLH